MNCNNTSLTLSTAEVADMLGVSPGALGRAVRAGRFPVKPITGIGFYKFPRAAIERLLTGEAAA